MLAIAIKESSRNIRGEGFISLQLVSYPFVLYCVTIKCLKVILWFCLVRHVILKIN